MHLGWTTTLRFSENSKHQTQVIPLPWPRQSHLRPQCTECLGPPWQSAPVDGPTTRQAGQRGVRGPVGARPCQGIHSIVRIEDCQLQVTLTYMKNNKQLPNEWPRLIKKKHGFPKIPKIRCFLMVTEKDRIMMMDEFHCFGAWEFVRGELFSFCCVRLLEDSWLSGIRFRYFCCMAFVTMWSDNHVNSM